MPFEGEDIDLPDATRTELEEIARSQALPAGFVLRAKIVLLLAEGLSYEAIQSKLDTTAPTIWRWKKRFLENGLDGFETQRPGQPPQKLTAQLRGRILEATRRRPRDGSTHWSCRKLASQLGISKDLVHRVWREAGLKPHQLERYLASDDPEFEDKAADIIGLYLNPPQHAAVFCVDEKTAIQALDRRDPVLPLSPGRAERHRFEYKRNGTLSLYAALNTKTGQVQGKTAARHTSQEFVAFLADVVERCAPDQQIHILCDHLSAHKTQHVDAFLATHPNVRLHFTPTYSSWLNQVELWFSQLQHEVLAHGIFTSVQDLARKLRRYINAYSKNAQPIQWKYSNRRHRIRHAYSSSTIVH
jgi:transposase